MFTHLHLHGDRAIAGACGNSLVITISMSMYTTGDYFPSLLIWIKNLLTFVSGMLLELNSLVTARW